MTHLIKLEGISKHYGVGDSVVKAVDGISINVEKGEFIAIMGPSGSGKSTAMNLVGSLDLPTLGKIFLEGHNISHLSESELAQLRGKKIGFIFQSFNLIPNLTALDNVALPMVFQDIPSYERERLAKKIIGELGLNDRMYHYPAELSGGQQQRVAIARALANNPEIILADEPTGNLDTSMGEQVMGLLRNLNEQGKTIIIVTHDSNLAMRHARKIFWIRDGKIEKITQKTGNKWKYN